MSSGGVNSSNLERLDRVKYSMIKSTNYTLLITTWILLSSSLQPQNERCILVKCYQDMLETGVEPTEEQFRIGYDRRCE